MFRVKGSERGGVSGYLVGLIAVTALIVGGIFLLKNLNSTDRNVDNTTTITTTSNDGAKQPTGDNNQSSNTDHTANTTGSGSNNNANTTTTTPPVTNNSSNNSHVNSGSSNLANTGDTTYTPTSLTATGPEDFIPLLIATVMVGAAIYAAWNYRLSRVAVRSALLRK